jgi:hypothetical protein
MIISQYSKERADLLRSFADADREKRFAGKSIDNLASYVYILTNPSDVRRDFTPRTLANLNKVPQKVKLNAFSSLAQPLYDFIHSTPLKSQKEYDAWQFKYSSSFLVELNTKLQEYGVSQAAYGKAQKVINMAMKYLFCLDGADRYLDRFKYCHMAIDRYTLRWITKEVFPWYNNGKSRPDRLVATKAPSWSNLEYGDTSEKYSYYQFQSIIRDYLNSATNPYRSETGAPLTPFEAEFYIWPEYYG